MNGPSNTAMHLSRHRMAIYFDEHTLRPGDSSVGRAPVSFKESCIKAARGQVSTDVPLDWF